MNANTMAAVNILHRLSDKKITVFTPYKKVKDIMESRRRV
jgi:maleate cis-trans isomerase